MIRIWRVVIECKNKAMGDLEVTTSRIRVLGGVNNGDWVLCWRTCYPRYFAGICFSLLAAWISWGGYAREGKLGGNSQHGNGVFQQYLAWVITIHCTPENQKPTSAFSNHTSRDI
ncbi:hypothetical protein N431DRAFT_147129 [Stipitochalara longipes BDJ]|nr:hypothetical protein N431DRAFT_147129 [Stipitochalara longipes BDJ]